MVLKVQLLRLGHCCSKCLSDFYLYFFMANIKSSFFALKADLESCYSWGREKNGAGEKQLQHLAGEGRAFAAAGLYPPLSQTVCKSCSSSRSQPAFQDSLIGKGSSESTAIFHPLLCPSAICCFGNCLCLSLTVENVT